MLEKKITFTDLEGNERTGTFLFHMYQKEINQILFGDKGLLNILERAISTGDSTAIMDVVDILIKKSYGRRAPDGISFMKTQEIVDSFIYTDAFSVLFMELVGDPTGTAITDFIAGIAPAGNKDGVVDGQKSEVMDTLLEQYPTLKDAVQQYEVSPNITMS